MKTKISLPNFRFLNSIVKKLNAHLAKMHQRNMRTTVLPEARNYARKNLPDADHTSMEPFLGTIKGAYNILKQDVQGILLGRIQKTLGSIDISTFNKRIQDTENVIRDTVEQIQNLTIDEERLLSQVDYAVYKKQSWLLHLLSLGDCFWIASSFLVLGDAMIWAIVFGIFLGIIAVAALKYVIQLIKEVEDKDAQYRYIKYTALGYLIFSSVLAVLRYWFFHLIAGSSVPFIILNPFVFIVFNMVAGIAIGAVVYYNYPTKSDLNIIHEIEKTEKEISKLTKKELTLQLELTDLLKQREEVSALRLQVQEQQAILLDKIASYYEEAIGLFKSENISKRSDNLFPPSFRVKHEPLSVLVQDDLLAI